MVFTGALLLYQTLLHFLASLSLCKMRGNLMLIEKKSEPSIAMTLIMVRAVMQHLSPKPKKYQRFAGDHHHFNHVNPSTEYYNCSNYVCNRGTCSNIHYIRLDSLRDKVFDELQKLIRAAQSNGFWDRIAVVKSIES